MSNFFKAFSARLAATFNQEQVVEATLPVESLSVQQTENKDNTITVTATVGLSPITLTVPAGTTYLQVIELSKAKVPGLNVSANMVTVLNTETNETISQSDLSRPVVQGNYSLEATSGTAGTAS